MLKKSLIAAAASFILFTIKDLIRYGDIEWQDSLLFGVITFTVIFIAEWSSEPYDWSKHKR